MEFPCLVAVVEAAELVEIEVVVVEPAGIVAVVVFEVCCYYYCP